MGGIILFGTGYVGKKIYRLLLDYHMPIKYWIDSNVEKQGKEMFGLLIYGPDKLKELQEAYVCISMKDIGCKIHDLILSYGVPEEKILDYTDLIMKILEQELPAFQMDGNSLDNRRKVIFDCTNGLGLGGVEAWSISLLERMETIGYDAYVIAPFGEYQVSEYVRQKTIFAELDTENVLSRRNIENIYYILQEYCPCIVISKSIDDLVMAVCMIKEKNPDAIWLVSVIHQGLDAVYKENKDVSPYVGKYLSVSEDIRYGIIELGIAADRVLHMTCPVPCPERLCRDYSINGREAIRLGYAGRLEQPQKRMDLLLKFLDELEKLQCDYHFEIAGDGGFSEDIKKFVQDRHLGEKVRMLGKLERSEIPDFWKKQDVCINISDHEGRSLSIMEAMANGAVPVVTATSGVREDIENSVNGYFVDIGNYKAMADRIQYLSENRYVLRTMGSKAHDVILQKSNMDKHVAFWGQVLSEF